MEAAERLGLERVQRGCHSSSVEDTGLLLRAIAFAADKHRSHRRKDAEASPYINHPIAVAELLANEAWVFDVDVLIAAILHDTVEDTDTTSAELSATFGARVSAIVAEVTDDKSLPKAERKRLQIEHARTGSAEAQLVKLADKIVNLRDLATRPPAGWSRERKREYFDWCKAVVDAMRDRHAALAALFDQAYAARP
jgi:GTP diphosphokinase / guanosine-3',5'-bis(diphosphate) 3'-diphosphatase